MKSDVSLTEGSIPRALLVFSLPILLGNLLQSVNGSVNAIWVGKYLGEAAFAAAGNANVVMFLLFGVMFGFPGARPERAASPWTRAHRHQTGHRTSRQNAEPVAEHPQ